MGELASVDIRPLLHTSNFRHTSLNTWAQALCPTSSISNTSHKKIPFSRLVVKMLFTCSPISCVTETTNVQQTSVGALSGTLLPVLPNPPLLLCFSLSIPSFYHGALSRIGHLCRSQTSPFTLTQDPRLLTQQSKSPSPKYCPASQHQMLCPCSRPGRALPTRKGHWDFQCKENVPHFWKEQSYQGWNFPSLSHTYAHTSTQTSW